MVRSGDRSTPSASADVRSVKPSRDIARLLEIMAALRTPGTGCPWDLEQNFRTIAPYTLEEAYEVADAIARDDLAGLKDELGDLLLQVVFHARMAQEQGAFDFGDVVEAITAKLIRRHPHVFADADGKTAEAVKGLWERIKAEEKAERGEKRRRWRPGRRSGRPARVNPCLQAAGQGRPRRASTGTIRALCSPRSARKRTRSRPSSMAANGNRMAAEVGDLLFAVVNLARHLDADPEGVLRETNLKFERRFASIERALAARGKTPKEATLAEMDALWDEAKAAEK